jgi:hypothetical protein
LTPRRILLAYAALALATAFYPALTGRLPVPAGNALFLLPDGRAPMDRNDELSDVPMQFLPWTRAVADAYRAGRMPFRLAANGCGTPLWANPQAQAATPTTLLAIVLPLPFAFAAAAALKLWLAAAGAFWFIRARGIGPIPSFWAGLAYGFAIHMTAWIHYPDTWPAAVLPWCLWALERLARGLPGGFLATLAGVVLLLLGGYPETELYVAVAGAIFFLAVLGREQVDAARRWKRLGLAAAAALLALGATPPYTRPAGLALARSERSAHVARALETARPALSAKDFLRPPAYWDISRFWLIPEAQGNPRDQDKFGPYSFAGRASGYAGILIVAFALAAFLRRRAPRSIVWTRRALVGLALYLLWYPPLVFVLHATPGVREAAARLTTNRANCIAVLLLALLAAWELDRIDRGESVRATRSGAILALLGVALVAAEYARASGRPPLSDWRAVSFALPVLLLSGVLAILALPAGRARRRTLAALLLAGTAVDLLRIGARFNPGTHPSDYFPVTPKVRELQAAARGGRFAASDVSLAGTAYMYGLEDVRVHGVVAPAAYVDALQAAAGYTGPAEYPGRVTRLDAPLLDFLNTRARLSPGGSIRAVATPQAALPGRLLGSSDPERLRARLETEPDFLRQALVLGSDETLSGRAEILSLERAAPETIRIRVRGESPRVLALPETDDGGWTASADGRSLPTLRIDGAFLGVRVPAGETTILCRYTPPGFRAGALISAVCLTILAGAAVLAGVAMRAKRG